MDHGWGEGRRGWQMRTGYGREETRRDVQWEEQSTSWISLLMNSLCSAACCKICAHMHKHTHAYTNTHIHTLKSLKKWFLQRNAKEIIWRNDFCEGIRRRWEKEMISVKEREGDDIDLWEGMQMMIWVNECAGDDCEGDDLRRRWSVKVIQHYELVLDWPQTAKSKDTSESEE